MKVLILAVILLFTGFSLMNTVPVIYSTTVTSSNDSLESSWINADYNDVSITLYVNDTMRVDYYIDYRVDTLSALTLAVDSIKTTGTALTGLSKAVILRGYGASAITNLIPGANQFKVRGYRHSSSGATGTFIVEAVLR